MQSSPGSLSPQAQSAVSLTLLALAALGLSLLLAIASLPKPRIVAPSPRHSIVTAPVSRPSAISHASPSDIRQPATPTIRDRPSALEPLLVPWAIAVDALAIMGLGVVWLVRRRQRA